MEEMVAYQTKLMLEKIGSVLPGAITGSNWRHFRA